MKLPLATHKRVLEAFFYDPETGVFTWKIKGYGISSGNTVSTNVNRDGYRRVGLDGNNYKQHRLAWFYVHGKWPRDDVDHINGDRSDNRICNLREATRSQNVMNSGKRKDGKTSKFRGVHFHKRTGQWQAMFKDKYLGIRRTEEEAHKLYLAEASKMASEFPMPMHPAHVDMIAVSQSEK